MKVDDEFKTRTMAKVLAGQGQLKKAAEIYTYLIKHHPEEKDLREELGAIKKRLNPDENGSHKELRPLYRKWIEIQLKYYQHQNYKI